MVRTSRTKSLDHFSTSEDPSMERTGDRHSSLAIFSRSIQIALGFVFTVSGISKIQNLYTFLASLYQFELFRPKVALFIAIFLPFFELALGVCLISKFLPGVSLLAGTVLLGLFVMVLCSVAFRGLRTSCECFGNLDTSDVTWWTALRTALIFLISSLGCWIHIKQSYGTMDGGKTQGS